MVYQIWSRRKKNEPDENEINETLSKFVTDDKERAKLLQGGRAERDLGALRKELESLTKQTRNLESQLGGAVKESAGIRQAVNPEFEDEDE